MIWSRLRLPTLVIVVILTDTLIWQPLGGRTVAYPTLLLTIGLAASRGWLAGAICGLAAGAVSGVTSVWPNGVHIATYITVVTIVSIIVRRVLATRSLLSFIMAISVGTFVYPVVLGGVIMVLRLFQPDHLLPVWEAGLSIGAVQAVVHPIIAYFVWSRFRKVNYAHTELHHAF